MCRLHLALALPLLVLALTACDSHQAPPADADEATTDTLRGELGGDMHPDFARANAPRTFDFPADHGPHPEFRNEWWYIVGNIDDAAGQRYGFQITLFRIALAPGPEERDSAWATRQIWMAHLALTDVADDAYHHAERFARAGDIGLAGAQPEGARIWLEDWTLERSATGEWRLQAATEAFGLDLALTPERAPVLHGDSGLSPKSGEPGNASYYYSKPRLATTGAIHVDGQERAVDGLAWLDREWSTSVLGPDQVGWDWFALQLDDGTDVMVYAMRRADGARSDYSYAAVMRPDGEVHRLGPDAFRIAVEDEWTSPRGGTYPARWRLYLDPLDSPITVIPVRADQEFPGTVRYWEGAVDIHADGKAIGRGYVELSGYARSD